MRYYLGLGSNDGDREQHLLNALNYLAEICDNFYSSTPYESPALHKGKVHYLNSVAIVDFSGSMEELNQKLKDFEVLEGRDEPARAEGRVPIDIDIVIADAEIIRPKDYACFFFKRGYEELQELS